MATGHIAYSDAVSSAIAVIQTLESSKNPQELYLIGAAEIVMRATIRAERIYKEHISRSSLDAMNCGQCYSHKQVHIVETICVSLCAGKYLLKLKYL